MKYCVAKRGSAWRSCSVCAPVSVSRPICFFRLRRSRRPAVPRSEWRPDPDSRRLGGGIGLQSLDVLQQFSRCCSSAWTCFRSSIACLVNTPCFRAFWFCFGGPEPGAPPCIRQRVCRTPPATDTGRRKGLGPTARARQHRPGVTGMMAAHPCRSDLRLLRVQDGHRNGPRVGYGSGRICRLLGSLLG